jgi:hypothetical protein
MVFLGQSGILVAMAALAVAAPARPVPRGMSKDILLVMASLDEADLVHRCFVSYTE